jgi:hypothetical protein
MPKSYGSGSAIHRYFDSWHEAGFFVKLWQAGLAEHEEMEGISWQWLKSSDAKFEWMLPANISATRSKLTHSNQSNHPIAPRIWQPSLARRKRRRT